MTFSLTRLSPPPPLYIAKRLNRKTEYFLFYTVCFLIVCLGVFVWYYSAGRTFIWQSDGWTQHYKALVYYGKYLRKIVRTLFSTGKLVIPAWDFSFGEGNDILSTLHYYVLGDPLTLLAAAFPTRYMWVLYDGLILLRLYLAGLFFSILCFYTGIKSRCGILAGALTYAFCSWGIMNAARHPYFLNPMIYLPLLILGIEICLRQKKPWLLIGATFLSAASNFYFFYMLALCVAVYTIVRLLLLYPKQISKALVQALCLAGYCILGTLLASGILLPVILSFLGSSRMSIQNGHLLFYPLKHYLRIPLILLNEGDFYWLLIGFSALTVPALFLLFRRKKEHSLLKVLFTICIIVMLFPILGQVTNGFSYISNRWCWAFALLCAYVLAALWKDLLTLSQSDFRFLSICLSGYFVFIVLCRFLNISGTENSLTTLSLIFIYLLLIARSTSTHQCKQFAALALTFVSIFAYSYYKNAPSAGNSVSERKTIEAVAELTNNETKAVKAAAKLDTVIDFYRYSGHSLTSNAGCLVGLSSTNYYWSIANPHTSSYRSQLQLQEPISYNYKGYDDRAALLSLAAVRYFVVPSSDTSPVPYGFTPIESNAKAFKTYHVYRNDHALPLAYTYTDSIAESDWNALNAVEKQEALLQTVVLDDKIASSSPVPCLTSSAVDYSVDCGKNVIQDGSSFVVTAAKSSVTLNFTSLPSSETYLSVTGLNYSGFSPYELNRRTGAKLTSPSAHFELFRKQILWSEATSLSLNLKTSSKLNKTLQYRTPLFNFYSGRHDFAVCLDYSEEPITSITITFPQTGIYSFDSLEVLCQPMEQYAAQIDALAQDTLQNLTIGTDHISGSISLQEDKWLCFAIPYSSGWKAYVDGEAVKLHHANIQYMALPLSAGQHHVELIYQTPFLTVGLCISGLTGLVLIGMYIFSRKKEGV